MELKPDPSYEGGLLARAESGERLAVKTKSNEGAGLITRYPETVFLRGTVIVELLANGEDLEAITEKITKEVSQEEGDPGRTTTLADGVIATIPVYNNKIRREEMLPAKGNELREEPEVLNQEIDVNAVVAVSELKALDEPETLVA